MAQVREGARPVGLAGHYDADDELLREYAQMAASADGFDRWMQRCVLADRAA